MKDRCGRIAQSLIAWFEKNKRDLPFRRTKDPYQIWISEIMAQQTRIAALIPYFERFTKQFPTVEALAAAEEEEVLKAWQGLGYYARARNLHKAAQKMVAECGGKVPENPEQLRKMPGIGAYTAGAVLSIAYGQKEPAVDGNATRVFARIEEIYEDVLKPQTIRQITDIIRDMMPDGQAGALTEAIMELGALVCLPQTPQCQVCPVRCECKAYQHGKTETLPFRSGPKPKKEEHRLILLAEDEQGRILMRKRSERLLHNLWEYVNLPVQPTQQALDALGLQMLEQREIGKAQHVFTHIIWHMQGVYAKVQNAPVPEDYEWVPKEEIETKALPTALSVFTKWGRKNLWNQ